MSEADEMVTETGCTVSVLSGDLWQQRLEGQTTLLAMTMEDGRYVELKITTEERYALIRMLLGRNP